MKCNLPIKLVFTLFILSFIISCQSQEKGLKDETLKIEQKRVMEAAEKYMTENIQVITEVKCRRSAGGLHDFYSEGDYWWPDTLNPDGPYIRRDGLTNPDNFIDHRVRMRMLSLIVPALTSAFVITDNPDYAHKAIEHIIAWFVDDSTMMNPNMLYSQAIYGRVTGRGIGIIDAIHLVEVVRAIMVLEEKGILTGNDLKQVKRWFNEFNQWITTHPYGIDERDNGNNHSTCWAMQVAMYASFTQNDSLLNSCRDFYINTLVPEQLSQDGSFPKELARTKPYGYSLFNLDAMYTLVHILARKYPDIWKHKTVDGLEIKKAVEYMYPYIKNKEQWPYPPDVMYFEDWPMRQASLLFATMAYGDRKYFDFWKTLNPDSEKNEVLRNFFIRQPVLWVE